MMEELKRGLTSSLAGKVSAVLMKPMLRQLKRKLSGDAKGGAILLGLRGVVLIGHGATSVEAVKNGTLACARSACARGSSIAWPTPWGSTRSAGVAVGGASGVHRGLGPARALTARRRRVGVGWARTRCGGRPRRHRALGVE